VKGTDDQLIGWSLPVGGGDDRLICKGDGKIMGRAGYLVLDNDLAPVLKRAFEEYRFHTVPKPAHKCALTVTVRPMDDDGASVPVVAIVGLEILGPCNFLDIANHRYEKAFMTVRVAPDGTHVAYGDGAAWVERLGGEEKFVARLRHKLRDLQRKAIAERGYAQLGSAMQAALAQSVNMAVANAAQQARFTSAFFGRR
jgi:hypothetical protein